MFRSSDIENELGLARMYIWRLVQEGLLERVGYGLYSLTTSDHNEHQSILEIATKMPSAVLCLLSALRFHDLTTQNPFEIWIAIPRGTRYPRPTGTKTRVFRFARSVYDAGIEKHILDGVEVKVYSPAKTVADCFYYERKVGLDIALEALRDAWRSHKVTMDELYYYAEVRNIKSKMLPYLNAIS